jgi:beta-lactamase superfamily II metal-dependent hydrolase
MRLRVFDVEHGACALVESPNHGPIALIDCGTNTTTGWTPVRFVKEWLGRNRVDHLVITNADQDHYANLAALRDGLEIGAFTRNPSVNAGQFEQLKQRTGPLSRDAQAYKGLLQSYTHSVSVPFNENMGGITIRTFWNKYPAFKDFNNLSLVAFVRYSAFQILFSGDLEKAGWTALLQDEDFIAELRATTILVASHHGRENGYLEDVFEYLHPRAVIVSDKPIVHSTQGVPQYQNCVVGGGVIVAGETRLRHVLTTRKDGSIRFEIGHNGDFTIYTHEDVGP